MDGKRAEWPVIGIDLGTTYSCVAVWKNNRATIISNDRGNRTTPSWVGFTNLDRNIGEPAVLQASTNTVNTVYDAKRLIGKKFSDDSVQKDIKFWPFKVVDGGDDKPVVSVTYMGEHKKLIPEEISAMVLSKMKGIAEDFLGTTVKNAIVTVPAYFNDSQRRATKDAGTIAGLNVIQIINEPTAAAIAYGLDNNMLDEGHSTLLWWKNNSARKNVLVFDLGGGTFDVSLVAMEKGDIKVEAVRGDSHLGGGDFDNRMVSEFVGEFKRKHKKDISQNPRAIGRLRAAAERAKRDLSAVLETQVVVDSLFEGIDFSTKITRARFEKLNMNMFKQCMETVDICLKDAGMEKSDVHELVLVGGSSRIPKIQQMLRELFGGKELCKGIHPDEAVAYGAAVHAANLSGVGTSNKDMKLVDVTPLSLGCENVDSECVVMIPRNTTIPVKKNKQWQTPTDNCTNALFNVYEGERQMAKDNNFLDGFTLTGFPLAPKGEIKFDLCFEIDVDGILNVSAVELSSGLRKQITIMHQRGRLSEKEIDRMVKEGEKYKAQDEKRMKDVKAKDELEMYANKVSEALDTTQLKISEYERKQLQDAIDETSKWLERNSDTSTAAECKKKLEAVQIICRRFGSKLLL